MQRGENGQAMVEFALFGLLLLVLTVGLIDAGRAAYQFNALAGAARYGARWASVQGGTCGDPSHPPAEANPDWCNLLGNDSNADFWNQNGNHPLDTTGACPTGYVAGSSAYYTLASLPATDQTTIVGAIAKRLDTNSGTSNRTAGQWTAGLDPNKTFVCISLPSDRYDPTNAKWFPAPGNKVSVYVYYPFRVASGLLGFLRINMVASSQYTIE